MKRFFTIAIVAMMLGACAADDPNRRTKTGAVIGAVAGAAIGTVIDKGQGTAIGAAVGALAGAGVGYYMDEQQREFEAALEDERRQHALEIERLRDDTLKLSLSNEVSFDVNRSEVKSAFYPTLDKLGDVLNRYDRTVVHVVGHTDSTGSDGYNLALSERRADSVAGYLDRRGVPRDRLRTEGRGESEPRSGNDTETGRQQNRRVEIYVKPIVEGQEQQAYASPRY